MEGFFMSWLTEKFIFLALSFDERLTKSILSSPSWKTELSWCIVLSSIPKASLKMSRIALEFSVHISASLLVSARLGDGSFVGLWYPESNHLGMPEAHS